MPHLEPNKGKVQRGERAAAAARLRPSCRKPKRAAHPRRRQSSMPAAPRGSSKPAADCGNAPPPASEGRGAGPGILPASIPAAAPRALPPLPPFQPAPHGLRGAPGPQPPAARHGAAERSAEEESHGAALPRGGDDRRRAAEVGLSLGSAPGLCASTASKRGP